MQGQFNGLKLKFLVIYTLMFCYKCSAIRNNSAFSGNLYFVLSVGIEIILLRTDDATDNIIPKILTIFAWKVNVQTATVWQSLHSWA
jgi:hypothetical protein